MKASILAVAAALFIGLFATAGYSQAQERTLESLHAALNLTSSQEDNWRNFEQVFIASPQEMEKRRNVAVNMAALTAPQRMDISIDLAESDLAALKRKGAALKGFYNTLSPPQQLTFDRETVPLRQAP